MQGRNFEVKAFEDYPFNKNLKTPTTSKGENPKKIRPFGRAWVFSKISSLLIN
ncbi:hypothetical protein AREALGSMS7_02973 [Arenibacter algicola]|uniref:Uncharacterized protein n=1 Tax=Arenibacter algicola TaxID=616991 RepID=A0A221UYH4_9FLAO|nr:hypothetical protein AREALGSMS7_02973 [Arenibacter algicola]